jgi:quercetin dioxygenase-like cupin family protein
MARRFVAGQGKSQVIIDGAPAKVFSDGDFRLEEIWATDGAVPDLKDERDIAVDFTRVRMDLAPGATRFRIVEFPPGDSAGVMHKTPTVDYLVVLEGEIDLILQDGTETHLKQGDCVVQLGGTHAWHNRSGRPTRMAAIAVGGTGGENTLR